MFWITAKSDIANDLYLFKSEAYLLGKGFVTKHRAGAWVYFRHICNFFLYLCYRLKKEHEKIRQETVKVILNEQGGLQEDARLIKLEQEEVRHRLSTRHTKATKDPDPFHQLYELRKGNDSRS